MIVLLIFLRKNKQVYQLIIKYLIRVLIGDAQCALSAYPYVETSLIIKILY